MMCSGPEFVRVVQSGRGEQFLECHHRVLVEAEHPHRLVFGNQRFLPRRILRQGHARRAAIRVATQRLDATEREHIAAGGIAPVGAECERAHDIEGGNDLAGRADPDVLAQVQTYQGVVHQQQRLAQRCTDVIGEFQRSRAGAALAAIDDDEVRTDTGFHHRLGDAEPFPGDDRWPA